jgi:hypothetical protein
MYFRKAPTARKYIEKAQENQLFHVDDSSLASMLIYRPSINFCSNNNKKKPPDA